MAESGVGPKKYMNKADNVFYEGIVHTHSNQKDARMLLSAVCHVLIMQHHPLATATHHHQHHFHRELEASTHGA